MQGSHMPLTPSNSLFDPYSPMDLPQDDSYTTQPSSLRESLNYFHNQSHCSKDIRAAVGDGHTECFARFHIDSCQTTAPSLCLEPPANQFQGGLAQDAWRCHNDLENSEQNFTSDYQCSTAQQSHPDFIYTDEALFAESYQVASCSELQRYQEDLTSSSASPPLDSSPTMERWSVMPEEPSAVFRSVEGLHTKETPDEEEEEEEEASGDKPYARLIHEALMQAPAHRMMLREIYDWFIQHTTKPTESGTNGWQNSIRHNLSMNQAFENDRMDASNPSQQARKANSVWILTEDAVRHGVQSTTRYRRNGSNKKPNKARIPAPLRQRSGAKGGRAARRAAKLRREEQMNRQGDSSLAHSAPGSGSYGLAATDPNSQADYFLLASPLTPESEPAYVFPPSAANNSYYYNLPDVYATQGEMLRRRIELPPGADFQARGDACMKELLGFTCSSPTQTVTQ